MTAPDDDQSLARWSWEVIKIAVPLVAIGVVLPNAAGLWETEYQEATRLRRAAEAEEARQDAEEQRRREKHWQDFWKGVERDFKRQ